MSSVTEYVLVQCNGYIYSNVSNDFTDKINKYLKNGWKIQGDIITHIYLPSLNGTHMINIMREMVKETPLINKTVDNK